jgi:hypothetical protein
MATEDGFLEAMVQLALHGHRAGAFGERSLKQRLRRKGWSGGHEKDGKCPRSNGSTKRGTMKYRECGTF